METTRIFKTLIELGKSHGYLTFEEINRGIPSTAISPTIIDGFFAKLEELGIPVVENEKDALPKPVPGHHEHEKKEDDDDITNPVKMYLSEMAKEEIQTKIKKMGYKY